MLKFDFNLRDGAAVTCLCLIFILGGCANQKLHNEGMDLVHEGHTEEGLQKLEQSSKADPENLPYRNDYLRSKNQAINVLLSEATTEKSRDHLDAAKKIYERVLKIEPLNRSAKQALEFFEMDKRHSKIIEEAKALFDKGDLEEARAALGPIAIENPTNAMAGSLIRKIDEQEAKTQSAEPMLAGKFRTPISLQFRDANLKMVFEALSRTSGINVLLDKDIKSDLKASIFVKDVSVADAIDLILMQSQLEKKVLSSNTIYVYPNTAAKLKELKDLKVRSFHLIYADAKQMMTLLKTLLKTKDIFVHEKTNSLIMRDTPEAIHLAEKMIADQDIADPEVMLEVEVLEITRARLRDLGLQYPASLAFSAIPPNSATSMTLTNMNHITSDSISVTTPTITLNAMLEDQDTNILSSPRLRVKNHEKAKIMIGERVPIITNSVTPVTGGTGSVITGTVSYQDVGLKFDVEPEIHLDNEVTIKLGLEVSSLGAPVTTTSGSAVYIVSTRNTSTSLRLHDGETQILGGLITDNDTSTIDKVPLLGQIPLLGHLFANDNSQKTKTEIILSITPHIVGNKKIPDAREMEYWSGTDGELRSDQLVLKPYGEVSLTSTSPGFSTASSTPATVSPSNVALAPSPRSLATSSLPPGLPAFAALLQPQGTTPVAAKPAVAPAAAKPTSGPVESKAAFAPADSADNAAGPSDFSLIGPTQAKVGDKISIILNSKTLQEVKTLNLHFGFDPSVLKAVDVIEGSSMKQNNTNSTIAKTIDQAGGDIAVDLSGSGATKGGGVVTLTFEVIAPAEETSVTINSIVGSMSSGEPYAPNAPSAYEVTVAQ
jgi:general secretion pathway protein D